MVFGMTVGAIFAFNWSVSCWIMERSGGVVTPPHSYRIPPAMYILFGFILFGILVAS